MTLSSNTARRIWLNNAADIQLRDVIQSTSHTEMKTEVSGLQVASGLQNWTDACRAITAYDM